MKNLTVKLIAAMTLATAAGATIAAAPTAALNHDPATYRNATQKAASEYKAATAKCDAKSGAEKDSCMDNAKSVRTAALAELDGKPAGLVWAKMDGVNPALVHLYQMWVAPECRGRGVARGLLDTALGWARERNARFVELEVTRGNSAAARLYERAGFRAVNAPVPMRPGSGLMLQPMRLVLED